MKFLLTSAGLTNKSISDALFSLVGKKAEDTSLVFIPTASNIETGDKSWLIDDLINLKKSNFKSIDIVDISAIDKSLWLPRIKSADVVFFGGGNPYHLILWMKKSGLADILRELLKDKVYVGLSAGSMVLGDKIGLELSQILFEEDLDRKEDADGLGYFDFYFLPHLNSPHFPNLVETNVRKATEGMTEKVYVLDDNSAIKIEDGKKEVISEGIYLEIN